MKRYLFLMLLFGSLFSIGCKKCIECKYEYDGIVYTTGEICGDQKQIQDVIDNKPYMENNSPGTIDLGCE